MSTAKVALKRLNTGINSQRYNWRKRKLKSKHFDGVDVPRTVLYELERLFKFLPEKP